MKPRDILAEIVDVLNGAGVEHMLTGSFAGAYHGLPRATQDIHLVIAPSEAELKALVSALQVRDYYVSEEAALEALETRGQFNAIDRKSGGRSRRGSSLRRSSGSEVASPRATREEHESRQKSIVGRLPRVSISYNHMI